MLSIYPTPRPGQAVRLFGFPGLFVVLAKRPDGSASHLRHRPAVAVARANPDGTVKLSRYGKRVGWDALKSSIVEVDGVPHALDSIPLAKPADDYPHGVDGWFPPAESYARLGRGPEAYATAAQLWGARPWSSCGYCGAEMGDDPGAPCPACHGV